MNFKLYIALKILESKATRVKSSMEPNLVFHTSMKAIIIQAFSRSCLFSRNYLNSLSCILYLQCKARRLISLRQKRFLQQESREKQNEAREVCVVIIQANWRSLCCCSNYQAFLKYVFLIQCRRRRFVAARTKNSLLLKNNKRIYCSSIIQSLIGLRAVWVVTMCHHRWASILIKHLF